MEWYRNRRGRPAPSSSRLRLRPDRAPGAGDPQGPRRGAPATSSSDCPGSRGLPPRRWRAGEAPGSPGLQRRAARSAPRPGAGRDPAAGDRDPGPAVESPRASTSTGRFRERERERERGEAGGGATSGSVSSGRLVDGRGRRFRDGSAARRPGPGDRAAGSDRLPGADGRARPRLGARRNHAAPAFCQGPGRSFRSELAGNLGGASCVRGRRGGTGISLRKAAGGADPASRPGSGSNRPSFRNVPDQSPGPGLFLRVGLRRRPGVAQGGVLESRSGSILASAEEKSRTGIIWPAHSQFPQYREGECLGLRLRFAAPVGAATVPARPSSGQAREPGWKRWVPATP